MPTSSSDMSSIDTAATVEVAAAVTAWEQK